MEIVNIRQYAGPVNSAVIEETICFENLNDSNVIIKSQFVLTLLGGDKILLANPEYFEYPNTEEGRKNLQESEIPKKYKDIVLNLWDNK